MKCALISLVALAACDKIITFEKNPLPPDAPDPGVCFTLGPDDADDDKDGTLNKDDKCPRVANEVMFDEDQDGLPDSCDPCPHLTAAGEDPDCDDVGAACDPDPTQKNVIDFYGFEVNPGFTVEFGVSFAMPGSAQLTVSDTNQNATFLFGGGKNPSYIDAVARIDNALLPVYWVWGVAILSPSTNIRNEIELRKNMDGSMQIVIEQELPSRKILAVDGLGTLTGNTINFELRVHVTASEITATASTGATIKTIEAKSLMIDPTITHGVFLYRDTTASTTKTTALMPYYMVTRSR